MGDFNSQNNRAVWFDIPVADLDRATKFYANVQEIHSIGPHGFRALILDSEGNRVALHSETDA